jgi:predicted nucleic acid-binding protein
MLYFDTSFVVPLVLREQTSASIAEYVAGLPAGRLFISHWTRVEFSSALGVGVRIGRLKPREAAEAEKQLERTLDESFSILSAAPDMFERAREFLSQHRLGLRAGDALHLAIASSHRAETIYSLDKTMLKAGRSLGLPLSSGIRLAGYPH